MSSLLKLENNLNTNIMTKFPAHTTHIETPLNLEVGLDVYHSTRTNKIVKFLSDLNVSYDKVTDTKKDIVGNIMEKTKEYDGVFVPSSLVSNESTFFVIDDIDIKIDAVDDKDQLT